MAKVDDWKRLRDELIFKRELIEKLQKEAKIKNEKDLYGDDDPTLLFHILVQKYNYLLDSLDSSSCNIALQQAISLAKEHNIELDFDGR